MTAPDHHASTVVESPQHGGSKSETNTPEAHDSATGPKSVPAKRRFGAADLICFSHLRWNFVYQRPQHLMSRFARGMRVTFVEEPVATDAAEPGLDIHDTAEGVTVVVPRLPAALQGQEAQAVQRRLLDRFLAERGIKDMVLWYYTPMALAFSDHLAGTAVVYDCMDELSAFKFAPPELIGRERELLKRADLVFTGGYSLYEAKRGLHPGVHPFPSSVDVAHFASARDGGADPEDQAGIPHPRLGFYGVLDERFDIALLDAAAAAKPDWQFVMVGPIVKIDPVDLPRRPNIHYLGAKSYAELPRYLAGWDVALLLFAINEHTRFISPTKTPEYLAAGRPVVSTPITDVVRHYADLVGIAGTPDTFIAACARALETSADPGDWLRRVDAQLGDMSWDATWERMAGLIADRIQAHRAPGQLRTGSGNGATRTVAVPRRAPVPAVRAGFDYLVVGAGFAGSVMAERLAAGSGKRVLVVDRRPHIGGNAFDHYDDAGILIHRYGPHIFHTNSRQVFDYLSRFTEWRDYQHRVLARVDGKLLPIPINLTTINRLYGLDLDPKGMDAFLAARAQAVGTVRTAEDVVIGTVGRELYEKFFRGYTRKQWGIDPAELDKSVTARVPTRTDLDDRYFLDTFQAMPLHGYTRMFERMLDHPNIKIMLNTDYREVCDELVFDQIVYTGPIDEFFDFRFGKLPYRSLRFRHEILDREQFQPVAVVNYPDESVRFTRITEYKYLTGQKHPRTSISYEYPSAEGDPYYPVPRPENALLYKKYQALADEIRNVNFIGRLATYRYYNMDQVVAQALSLYDRIARTPERRDANGVAGTAADIPAVR